MGWNDHFFISNFSNWLREMESDSIEQTADEISRLYVINAETVIPNKPKWESKAINLKNKKIIKDGFIKSFNLCYSVRTGSYLNINPILWSPAANSIIKFWKNTIFDLTPPPGGLVGSSNKIESPGLSTPLNIDIGISFRQENHLKCAQYLNKTFKDHLLTIKGKWSGTASGSSSPLVVDWVGLS